MKAIPIFAGTRIAREFGYDQVVILARKVGERGGEHVTTYGVDKVHCNVAARMGDTLKRVAQWPAETADREHALALLDRLESGVFSYDDYDLAAEQIGALKRYLRP